MRIPSREAREQGYFSNILRRLLRGLSSCPVSYGPRVGSDSLSFFPFHRHDTPHVEYHSDPDSAECAVLQYALDLELS